MEISRWCWAYGDATFPWRGRDREGCQEVAPETAQPF
jgi:hypothetical protein